LPEAIYCQNQKQKEYPQKFIFHLFSVFILNRTHKEKVCENVLVSKNKSFDEAIYEKS
jgi:hypothetical protein